MENQIFELQYAMDTFYFLICGALVMWMAAGFSMLEAGLVRTKNTTEILTKNVGLFAIACTMYLVCAPQVFAPEVAPTGNGVSRLGIGDPKGSRHPAPHHQAAGSWEGLPSRSWPKS